MTEILIIVLLIFLNGILSMSEIALISSRKSYLQKETEKGNKRARMAFRLFNDPDRFLSTVQIGITAIGILTGIYSGDVLADNFAVLLESIGVAPKYSHITGQTIIVIAVTYFTIIFGELVPKRIGMSAAEKVSLVLAAPMSFLSAVASPFVKLLSVSTAFVLRVMGVKDSTGKVTEDEILSMVKEGRIVGEVQPVEEDIMERVFLLGDLKAESLMTHRKDVVFINADMTRDEVIPLMERDEVGIFPVFSKERDEVVGVVEPMTLALSVIGDDFSIDRIMQPAVYIHENLDVYKALQMMREKHKSHLLVCDEFGSFRGIITLRDIMEGLVGVMDENPNEPLVVKREGKDEWLVDGQMPFYDFLAYFDKEELFDEAGYNTVAGLILDKLEHIPQAGESLSWKCFSIEVVDMDGARIDKVAVSLPLKEEDVIEEDE